VDNIAVTSKVTAMDVATGGRIDAFHQSRVSPVITEDLVLMYISRADVRTRSATTDAAEDAASSLEDIVEHSVPASAEAYHQLGLVFATNDPRCRAVLEKMIGKHINYCIWLRAWNTLRRNQPSIS
jgi:hypothetical protein